MPWLFPEDIIIVITAAEVSFAEIIRQKLVDSILLIDELGHLSILVAIAVVAIISATISVIIATNLKARPVESLHFVLSAATMAAFAIEFVVVWKLLISIIVTVVPSRSSATDN